MKILLVDDNEDARVLVRTMLESQDYIVKDSENGKMAIDFAKKWLPDLIISDILMPEMDGYEFCRIIKMDEQLKSIPVILFTVTYTDSQDRELAEKVGTIPYEILTGISQRVKRVYLQE